MDLGYFSGCGLRPGFLFGTFQKLMDCVRDGEAFLDLFCNFLEIYNKFMDIVEKTKTMEIAVDCKSKDSGFGLKVSFEFAGKLLEIDT